MTEQAFEEIRCKMEHAHGGVTALASVAQRLLLKREWLGGDQDANHYSERDEKMREAGQLVLEALRLLKKADHLLAMERAQQEEPAKRSA